MNKRNLTTTVLPALLMAAIFTAIIATALLCPAPEIQAAPTAPSGQFFSLPSVSKTDSPAVKSVDYNVVLDTQDASQIYITVSGTESSGTATVDVSVETSANNSEWTEIEAFSQWSATSSDSTFYVCEVDGDCFHRYVRVVWDFSGTGVWVTTTQMTARKR